MLDRNLLHALKERKRFNTLEYAVPQGAFDQDTVNMIKWFKRYFDRYTEHDSINIDTLETFIKLEGKLNDDQHAIIKSLLRGLREPVGDDVIRATVGQLNELRAFKEAEMLLKRYDDGAEIDIITELTTLMQIAKQRIETQDKAIWCDEDIWELIQADADDSGYKLS